MLNINIDIIINYFVILMHQSNKLEPTMKMSTNLNLINVPQKLPKIIIIIIIII